MTNRITTFSIMTLSIITLSIITLSKNYAQHKDTAKNVVFYAESLFDMLSVTKLHVVMLSAMTL
jgi:hypothetical protein